MRELGKKLILRSWLWFFPLLINAQALELSMTSLVGGDFELSWSQGALHVSDDLLEWKEVVGAASPYLVGAGSSPQFFKVVLIPIDVFVLTGQSNALHKARNYSPYNSTVISGKVVFAEGNGTANAGHPTIYDHWNAVAAAGRTIGSIWEFARELENSSYQSEVAWALTGSGGRPAWEWRNGGRKTELENALDTLIADLESTGRQPTVRALIVNQGEREAATGQNWASAWSTTFAHFRARYGNQVQIYIQSLNDLGLMGQAAESPAWTLTKSRQHSLDVDSGSSPLANTWVIDGDVTGTDSANARDGVHYSDLGQEIIGVATFQKFQLNNPHLFSN